MKKARKTKLYNLIWMLNGNPIETVVNNKPFPLCQWNKAQKEITTHKTGVLIILENK